MKHQDLKFCAAMAFFFMALMAAFPANAAPGDIHTVAGTGSKGYSGDAGPAAAAAMANPYGVAVDASGNVYFSDGPNQRVRKVDASGNVTTVAGLGKRGFGGDGGSAVQANLNNPAGLCVDSLGNLYIADSFNNRIRKVTPSGTITTVAGSGAKGYSGDRGPAVSAALNRPYGVAVDGSGMLYIADSYNNVVRRVDQAGIITTVAGTAKAGYSGDGGPASSAQLNKPESVAFDSLGSMYIADTYNSVIRKVDKAGTMTTVAGIGKRGYSGDGGAASSAMLNYPTAVAVNATGNIFVSDFKNNRVRMVGSSGMVSTVAGTGMASGGGDCGPASSAALRAPFGLALDAGGNLYIADSGNFKVKMVEGSSYKLPASAITAPASGYMMKAAQTAISGKAEAADGVAFVEVSTDGGETWTQASGTTDWSLDWTPPAKGKYAVLSRATGVSGKTGALMGYSMVKVRQGAKMKAPSNGGGGGGTPPPSPSSPSSGPHIYGPGIQSISLQDTGVGKYSSNQQCALRFRADHTGSIASVLQYLIWSTAKSGYNGGTGGSAFKVELRADDGSSSHLPSTKILASATYANPMQGSHFPVIKFDSPAQVQQGQLYHIVYTNLDSDPATNWCSVDNLIAMAGNVTHPLQPGLSDDFAVEVGYVSGGSWSVRDNQTPIYQVTYTDGYKEGMGYMEVMIENPHVASGSSMVRETFTVSGADQTVSSVSVKLHRTSGTGNLVVRLEYGDGTGIEEVPVPASWVGTSDTWVTATFKQPLVLNSGKSYNLVLKTDSSTTYSIYTVERGDHYGFDPATYYKDGFAQFTTGSGWTGWTKAGGAVTNVTDTDLQFYFSAQ